jgi:hypothetical protein
MLLAERLDLLEVVFVWNDDSVFTLSKISLVFLKRAIETYPASP